MNILLWVLQGVLALFCVAGGAYKLAKPEDVAKQARALSVGSWRLVGAFEFLCGVLLIAPAAAGWMPALTTLAAAALALETLGISALYARISTKLVAANPLPWSATMALMAAFVAYGRYALSPLA